MTLKAQLVGPPDTSGEYTMARFRSWMIFGSEAERCEHRRAFPEYAAVWDQEVARGHWRKR